MSKYDEYVEATTAAGEEPLEFNDWKKSRLAAGREAAAEAKAAEKVAEANAAIETLAANAAAPVPKLPEHMIFWAENRFRVEVMQAGGKTVINGQVVVQPHKVIEFIEHHWTADMADQEDREKAEWLLQSRALRKGEIVVVPQVTKTTGPTIQTGPRTSHTPKTRHEQIERPTNQQAIVEALTAPLNG